MPENNAENGAWNQALSDLWKKQSRWSRKADSVKKQTTSLTGPLMAMTLLGVLLGTATPALSGCVEKIAWLSLALGIVPALLVTISAYLTKEFLGPKREQDWILARTIAEQLKAEGYIYAASAPPYGEPAKAPGQLFARAKEVEAPGAKLGLLPAPATDLSKHPQIALTADQYLGRRIKGQIDWHLEEARKNQAVLGKWRALGIVLGLISLVIGAVGTLFAKSTINVWLGMVTTLVATVNAFVFSRRYEYLISAYAGTARTLEDLSKSWQYSADKSKGTQDRFVLDCEAALAGQNKSWASEFTQTVSDAVTKSQPT